MPEVPAVPHRKGSLTLALTHRFRRRGIIFDESNPKRFHLGGTDLSIAPVVVADGFRVSSARRCFVESASGPRLPGDDPLVVAKESANLDSTKARDTVRG